MELSFGEQIKILLNRKHMTIKDLAELYTQTTGQPMSRQNLTQRLKRDNFPEQDMYTIAALLGYRVSIRLEPASQEASFSALSTAVQTCPPPADSPAVAAEKTVPEEPESLEPIGEINPLTGEEYLNNTIRQHPELNRFLQVYDRTTHTWTDVEETYFWQFQEKKKQMLGADYHAPIRI